LRHGWNVLLLLCSEVRWRWVVGFVAHVVVVGIGVGGAVNVGVYIVVRIGIGLSVGLAANIADVAIVARRVFVNSRLGWFDSLHGSLHKAEVVRQVDHRSLRIRVARVFEGGRRDSRLLFALASARGFEGKGIVGGAGLGEVREGLSQCGGVDDNVLLRASWRPARVLLRGITQLGELWAEDRLLVVTLDLEGGADGIVALGIEVDGKIGVVGVVGADGDGAMV